MNVRYDIVDDSYLTQKMKELASIGRCDYTGKRGLVVPMDRFAKYVSEKLHEYYANPDDEELYLSSSFDLDPDEDGEYLKDYGGYVLPVDEETYDDTEELLTDLGFPCVPKEFRKDLEEYVEDHRWVRKDPCVISKQDELKLTWKWFSDEVIHRRRFTFLAADDFFDERELHDNCLDDILTEISRAILTQNLLVEWDTSIQIIRARPLKVGEEVKHKFEEITSPPDSHASQSRMSPAGVSMFYGAINAETARKEASENHDGVGRFLMGCFVPKRNLRLVDFTKLPDEISIWMDNWEYCAFLKEFVRTITKPVKDRNLIHQEYVPSQIITEYLRYMFRDESSKPLDGVVYKSAIDGRRNVVLFCNQLNSKEILQDVKIWEVE